MTAKGAVSKAFLAVLVAMLLIDNFSTNLGRSSFFKDGNNTMWKEDSMYGIYQVDQESVSSVTSSLSQPEHGNSPSSLSLLVAVISYDFQQRRSLELLMESLEDVCALSFNIVDVVVFSTVVWPKNLLHRLHPSCGSLTVRLKSPSWKKRLVNFARPVLYEALLLEEESLPSLGDRRNNSNHDDGPPPQFHRDYDLLIYTEDDMNIRLRHIHEFLRETKRLEDHFDAIGQPDRLFDYSIGFLRYEEETKEEEGESLGTATVGGGMPTKQIIWEHPWDTSSVEAFRKKHIHTIPSLSMGSSVEQQNHIRSTKNPASTFQSTHSVTTSNSDKNNDVYYYFNGGGTYHQALFMATPRQLLAWRDRPPNCRFNDTTHLDNPNRREKVSSLHLFHQQGCNVTQLIPVQGYRDFLIHHTTNYQHKLLFKQHQKDDSKRGVASITVEELGSWLERSTATRSDDPHLSESSWMTTRSSHDGMMMMMFNDETKKDDFHPNLTEFFQSGRKRA